jgi:hypothetical protein
MANRPEEVTLEGQVYRCPQLGDAMSPKEGEYGVPGELHLMTVPSPMFQVMCCAVAVAVTDSPGTEAVAWDVPQVAGPTAVHIHTGSPTRPEPDGLGASPMAGPVMGRRLIACSARLIGDGNAFP